MGRSAAGVRGINLSKGDEVVALAIVVPDAKLLVAGENGIGKRTDFEEYRAQSRGGKGIITMKTNEKTGAVVGALTVRDADEIMLITVKGQMVRTCVKDIREAGRNTQGVKLIELDSGDKLQAIASVIGEDKEDSAAETSRRNNFQTSLASRAICCIRFPRPDGGRKRIMKRRIFAVFVLAVLAVSGHAADTNQTVAISTNKPAWESSVLAVFRSPRETATRC